MPIYLICVSDRRHIAAFKKSTRRQKKRVDHVVQGTSWSYYNVRRVGLTVMDLLEENDMLVVGTRNG